MHASNALRITNEEINKFSGYATNALKLTKFTPNFSGTTRFPDIISGNVEITSIKETLTDFGHYGEAMPNEFNQLYLRLWTGIMLGYAMVDNFDNIVGVDKDIASKRQKIYESNLLFSIVISRAVLDSKLMHDVILEESVIERIPELPEYVYTGLADSRNWSMFYLTQTLKITSNSLHDSLIAIKYHFQQILINCFTKISTTKLEHLSRISSLTYLYEGADDEHTDALTICIDDWVADGAKFSTGGSGFDFITKLTVDHMVGNPEIKVQSIRSMDGLLCYDPITQRNPYADLGGFQNIPLWSGIPGVGKSMLVEIMINRLHKIASELGLPLIRRSFEEVSVDSFQGISERSADRYFESMNDPSSIFLADMDDAENKLGNRSLKSTSEGSKGIVASFLRNTEGAGSYFHKRNNVLMPILSNLPDLFDPAVLSRIGSKTEMVGAVTVEDFMDLLYLGTINKNKSIYTGEGVSDITSTFWDITDPIDYSWMEGQARLTSISKRARKDTKEYQNAYDTIDAMVLKASSSFPKNSPNFFGRLFQLFKEKYQMFSPRDVRNINKAVDSRMMDFDFPEEWATDLDLFFARNYDEKKALLLERSIDLSAGRSFTALMEEETIEYLANYTMIQDKEFNRLVAERIKQLNVNLAAGKLI